MKYAADVMTQRNIEVAMALAHTMLIAQCQGNKSLLRCLKLTHRPACRCRRGAVVPRLADLVSCEFDFLRSDNEQTDIATGCGNPDRPDACIDEV